MIAAPPSRRAVERFHSRTTYQSPREDVVCPLSTACSVVILKRAGRCFAPFAPAFRRTPYRRLLEAAPMSFRTSLLALSVGALVAVSGRTLHAQGITPVPSPTAPDTAVHMLAAVQVHAEAPADHDWMGRADAAWRIEHLQRENRFLARRLAGYDRTIDRLQAHLDSLKTVVTDSLTREIAEIDAQTAETHAERLALEEKLRTMEAASSSPRP